jgi:hypothetical protein
MSSFPSGSSPVSGSWITLAHNSRLLPPGKHNVRKNDGDVCSHRDMFKFVAFQMCKRRTYAATEAKSWINFPVITLIKT